MFSKCDKFPSISIFTLENFAFFRSFIRMFSFESSKSLNCGTLVYIGSNFSELSILIALKLAYSILLFSAAWIIKPSSKF